MNSANSKGVQSTSMFDREFTHSQAQPNFSIWPINANEFLTYRCLNRLFGGFAEEQIRHYVMQSSYLGSNYLKLD